jgi:hypothetical protein
MMMVHVEYTSYSQDRIVEDFRFSQVKQIIQAVRSPSYIHSRTRQWCRQDCTSVYHKDSSSPSGKMLAAGGPDVLVAEILRRHRKASPLSPTEMLGA